jgi:hypothetical protein
MTSENAEIQRCSTCLETKSLDNFYKNQARPTGHGTICKECTISKRKSTHRYCKKCRELKEIENYKGCSVICSNCVKIPTIKRRVRYGKISSQSNECVNGFADWI